MNVMTRLDEARRQTNVLEHPFYQRWSAGELSREELAVYAGEYRHATVALAEASAMTAELAGPEHRSGLRRHAEEEAAHVALWDEFARAAAAAQMAGAERAPGDDATGAMVDGAGQHRPGEARGMDPADDRARTLAETQACAAAWTAGADVLEHLAVLYAIEAGQPEISQTKLDGLVEHYGYTPDAPATEYFRLHRRLDVEHARQAGELIEALLAEREDAEEMTERMVSRAQAALRGNWLLLDGVLAATATPAGSGSASLCSVTRADSPIATSADSRGSAPTPA